jgi:hypothetical protein
MRQCYSNFCRGLSSSALSKLYTLGLQSPQKNWDNGSFRVVTSHLYNFGKLALTLVIIVGTGGCMGAPGTVSAVRYPRGY